MRGSETAPDRRCVIRIRQIHSWPALLAFISIGVHPAVPAFAGTSRIPPATTVDPCPISPDSRRIETTGLLARSCGDCWGDYEILPDPVFEPCGITSACSIDADWASLLGKRVRVEGMTILVHGGYGGFLGEALAVGHLELLTPAERTTWGRVRSLYR